MNGRQKSFSELATGPCQNRIISDAASRFPTSLRYSDDNASSRLSFLLQCSGHSSALIHSSALSSTCESRGITRFVLLFETPVRLLVRFPKEQTFVAYGGTSVRSSFLLQYHLHIPMSHFPLDVGIFHQIRE